MEDYYSQENVGDKGYISEEEFKQTMKRMRERLRGIEEEKKKVVDQKAIEKGMNLIINSIKSLYSSVKSNLEQLDWQTKRGIIRALVERIQIGYDQVEVAFRIEEPAQDGEIFNLQHCTGRHNKGAGEICQGIFDEMILKVKSGRRSSNPRPQPWQGCALPTELLPQLN